MYLIVASFFLTNLILVIAQGYDYDQPPPGVPPKAYPNPTSQGKIVLTISTLCNVLYKLLLDVSMYKHIDTLKIFR